MKQSMYKGGFTLLEIIVVLAVIAIFSTIALGAFSESRQLARDKFRQTSLQELQLAITMYHAENDAYPAAGCGAAGSKFVGPGPVNGNLVNLESCDEYIVGLVPKYIAELPRDPRSEDENNRGVYYRSDGTSYKLMFRYSAEVDLVDDFDHPFARCPVQQVSGQCSAVFSEDNYAKTYAVYSAGAENW
jgi:prepilin-type N-terminal cleavage/methylation domain-containing protein